jgi:hypothetical protein
VEIIDLNCKSNIYIVNGIFTHLNKSGRVDNLKGVTLHLAFANHDLLQDLLSVATKKLIDSVPFKTVGHEALLLAQMNQKKRYQDNQAILKKGSLFTSNDLDK